MLYNRKSPSGYTYGRKIELHPKSYLSNFWGAVQYFGTGSFHTLFSVLPAHCAPYIEKFSRIVGITSDSKHLPELSR